MGVPKRFALSTLLLVMLLASLLFGLIQWRRLQLIREFEELAPMAYFNHETRAFPIISPIVRQDGWWPAARPRVVFIYVMIENPGTSVEIGSTKYSIGEAKEYLTSLSNRLKGIGLNEVRIEWEGDYYNDNVALELHEAIQ